MADTARPDSPPRLQRSHFADAARSTRSADEVLVAGADGRQPTETYFWKHNPSLQYPDALMQTVFDAHPSFFRDRDYADYYDTFCLELEEMCRMAETSGQGHSRSSPELDSRAANAGCAAADCPV